MKCIPDPNACVVLALMTCLPFTATVVSAAANDEVGEHQAQAGTGHALAPKTERTAEQPIVIAHRGASSARPEHTIAAYRLALLQAADFIETDLVVTADGVLVARHDNVLAQVQLDPAGKISLDAAGLPIVASSTTNVASRPEYRDRLVVKPVDGRLMGGWFIEDFTLQEVKTLRARERMPSLRPDSALYDDQFSIPTLDEIIDLVELFEAQTGWVAGLYIEIKHPTYSQHEGRRLDGGLINQDPGMLLLENLVAAEFVDPARLYIQSFEVASLLALRDVMTVRGLDIPLIQLFGDVSNLFYVARPYDLVYHAKMGDDLDGLYGELRDHVDIRADATYADLAAPEVIAFMAERYAAGIGLPKHDVMTIRLVTPQDTDGDGQALQRTELTGATGAIVGSAKAAGLLIHPYTLRSEEPFLVRAGTRVLPVAVEAARLLEAGVDGFFIDDPAEGRAAVDAVIFRRMRSDTTRVE